MAKTSMIEREKRRIKLVKQQAAKRAQLKETIRSPKSTDSEREEAARKLQTLPRDGSASRVRNRCAITGARAACIASSASAARSCARPPCAATSRACAMASW